MIEFKAMEKDVVEFGKTNEKVRVIIYYKQEMWLISSILEFIIADHLIGKKKNKICASLARTLHGCIVVAGRYNESKYELERIPPKEREAHYD